MTSNNRFITGRLNSGDIAAIVKQFNQSHTVDRRLAQFDITCSLAHSQMLVAQGILTALEGQTIADNLNIIKQEIDRGQFEWSDDLEDVHMHIEKALIDKIGDIGKKLHTARSRNDQVATDLRLWSRLSIEQLCARIHGLQLAIIDKATEYCEVTMPSLTHLQFAMPTVVGHHLLSWFEMLERDYERLINCRERLNECPLGSAAAVGTNFDIDRNLTSQLLQFRQPTHNSLDSVSDRDFAMELANACSIGAVHLSRFAEEIIYWMSTPIAWLQLPDALCTGSSIMKAQPLAYNKDNQEDKALLFDCFDNFFDCLQIMQHLVAGFSFDVQKLQIACEHGFLTATDLADYLVMQGATFRDAHSITGNIVSYAIEHKCQLHQVPLQQLQSYSDYIQEDIYDFIGLKQSIARKKHLGGTAISQVKIALKNAEVRIAKHRYK